MKLLSIYVGKPRTVQHNGQSVDTGIYKEEAPGPLMVHTLNIEGDQQADLKVHGGPNKAVYAYPSEHYEFWRDRRPDLTFHPGVFGENLSVSGFNESTVCIGDVYRIGRAVRVQVTTPRMPCFKLGIKMGDPRFVKDFMDERKNGFYFKVLEEGEIAPGDKIEKLSEDGHGLSIDEVIQLYTIRKEDVPLLKKAVSSTTLPEDWREYFEKRLVKL